MISKIAILLILFSIILGGCSSTRGISKYMIRDTDGNRYEVIQMPDNKDWTTENINTALTNSFCYDSAKSNCDRYGRLYFWQDAMAVCGQLGEGWCLPTKDDWQQLAKHFGGVFNDSGSNGKEAFIAIVAGGTSQFNALLGGGGDLNRGFRNIEAHGFYWTATEINDSTACFANFGKGRPALFLQNDGEKYNAFSVRCVKTK